VLQQSWLFALHIFALSIALSACTDEVKRSPEETACLDLVSAVGESAGRCGRDEASNRAAFLDAFAEGDCANVEGLRSESELRDTCIPFLDAAECELLFSIIEGDGDFMFK